MSFRNIKLVVPRETSTCKHVILDGTDFKEENLNVPLPNSFDYSLKDMIVAGVPVAPVDPTVIHDSSSTCDVAAALIDSFDKKNEFKTE